MSSTQAPGSNPKPTNAGKSLADSKPGSIPVHLDLPHDFGARADDSIERQYASQSALNQDPGRLQTRSNDEGGGTRQAGVGTSGQGAGAGSGGDVDSDFVGVGTGGRTLANSIPDKNEQQADGPDRTGGSASAFASGKPANKENQDRRNLTANDNVPRGGTVTYDKDKESGTIEAEGADAIRTTSSDDPYADGAAGEISRGESAGASDSSSSSAKK